ncbi:Conserved_hypothetical protein [Hexamita inflata]|uniref:Uncharacterized protein n=1 Tax=Hexamita inflata TaxID=28002 RepID=A0AA86QX63_9EUKA|nr:Conserved hypothetical protein [Hexamita inflata]
MKEQTYIQLLDTFTWTVVALLSVYIILWIIENYDTKSIDLNDENKQHDDFEDIKMVSVANDSADSNESKKKQNKNKKGK